MDCWNSKRDGRLVIAKEETDITNKIMLALSPLGVVCWKNTRGLFWTMDKKRKIRAGLAAPGSSDLIGFKRIKITQDMVNSVVAIFCAIEVKTDKGYASSEQKDFIAFVKEAGGYAGVARSPDDAKEIIK